MGTFSRGRWAGSSVSGQRLQRGWQLWWWEVTGPLGRGGDFTKVLTGNARCHVTGLGRMEITETFTYIYVYIYTHVCVKCMLDNIAYMAFIGPAWLLHLHFCASHRNSDLIKCLPAVCPVLHTLPHLILGSLMDEFFLHDWQGGQ